MKQLPIDVVPGTNPPRFRWRRSVNTMIGKKTVDCDGALPPQVEDAVADIIALVKEQEREIEALMKQVEGHCERIAQQSELLSKRAEKVDKTERAEQQPQPHNTPSTKGGRKGSG